MLFLLKIKLCFGILNLSKAQAFDKKLNVVLYIVNVAGIGFICLNYYEVEIHFQYFVLLFVHNCGILFLDILMLNY